MYLEVAAIVSGAAAAGSTCLTAVVRRFATVHGVLDLPNERSSHTTATPRGGGIAVVASVTLSLSLLATLRLIDIKIFLAAVGGGAAVAVVGYLDDRYHLPAKLRLTIHFAAAAWAVLLIGGAPPLQIGHQTVYLGWFGDVLTTIGIVWLLNLFNFMDGIDGIAATEAVFVALAGSVLALVSGGNLGYSLAGIVFSAAWFGFLFWNWAPAKIFMGDVGSGYIGYFIGVLALAEMRIDPAAFWVWLILTGVFFIDATVTLSRRLLRGERVYEAHRGHAYQRLARRWKSHQKVTIIVALLNLLWLFPLGLLATLRPAEAPWIAVLALAPLTLAAVIAGSGSAERYVSP